MQVKENIEKIALKALQKEKFPEVKIQILKPKVKEHGDYSLSIALELGKKLNQNPIEIAQKLKSYFEKEGKRFIEKVEIVNPGFINLFLNKAYLEERLTDIAKGKYKQFNFQHKKIQVEFISANPTGPLTLGNARGGPFGDVLGNILKRAGNKVEKAYYINDHGNQIKVLGHSVLKDEQAKYAGEYIDFLHNRIGDEKDPYKIGKWAAYIVLTEMIEPTVKKMNIKMDEWFSESWLYENKRVEKVLKFLEEKGYIYENEGAQWFRAKDFGDERDRVVIKSDKNATYLLGDIAYHEYKFKDKKYDKVINVWGADHAGDVKGLEAGVAALGYEGKLETVLLQFVTLISDGQPVKMSKREGNYVTMADLLNDIPVDVVRFFFLSKSANTHLNFDLKLAQEQSEKNPVYYIQYAYVRILGILNNSNVKIKKLSHLNFLKEPAEINLIKELLSYEEMIEELAQNYEVHKLTQYAIDLANAFHRFYSECKVLTEDKKLTLARLELVFVTEIILKNVLEDLGMSIPEKM